MQLPEKLELFSRIFIAFLECALNYEHFGKKDELPGSSISEVIESERRL